MPNEFVCPAFLRVENQHYLWHNVRIVLTGKYHSWGTGPAKPHQDRVVG
jgi:hypothetical protein